MLVEVEQALAPPRDQLVAWTTQRNWYYGWVIVAVAALTVSAGMGTRVALGVLLVPLVDAFGWSRGLVAGAIAVNALVWAVSATPMGMLVDRWGPQRAFSAAALAVGLGLALAATAQEPWQLYLGIGVLGGIGVALLLPNQQGAIVTHWFVQRRGLAVGIVGAGMGLGVLVLAPLTQWIIERAGWQAAFLVLAGLFVVVVAPLNALLQRHRPVDCGLLPDAGSGAFPSRPREGGPTVRLALGHPRFWALVISFVLAPIPPTFLAAHGVAYLVDVGYPAALAAAAVGLSGACMIGGMLLWGTLADRWGGEWAFTVGSLTLVAAIALLWLLPPGQAALVCLYALLFALGYASRQGLSAFLGAALLQGRAFGTLMGILGAQLALGSALGPAMGGWLYDHTGGYEAAFALSVASVVGAIVCLWVAAPRHGLLRATAPVPMGDVIAAPRSPSGR